MTWRAPCRVPDMTQHVAVWIDHKEARVFRIHAEAVDEATILAPLHHLHHKHPKGPEGVKAHPNDVDRFFHDLGRALAGTDKILVVGPSTAKLEFMRYLHKHDRALEPRIVGVETVDHPTDRQMVAYARTYFQRSDRMQGAMPT